MVLLVSDGETDPADSVSGLVNTALRRGWILTEVLTAARRNAIFTMAIQGEERIPRFASDDQVRHLADFCRSLLTTVPYDDARDIHAWFLANGVSCTNGADMGYLAFLLHRDLYHPDDPPVTVQPVTELLPGTKWDGKDRAGLTSLCIDGNGLSPLYPDLHFECRAIDAWRDNVTIRRRPAIRQSGASQLLTKAELGELQIGGDQRSPLYPGRIFDIERVVRSAFFRVTTRVETIPAFVGAPGSGSAGMAT